MKDVWLRGSEPKKQILWQRWLWPCILAAATFIIFYVFPLHAQMCGDCDNDNKVTIAELVTAINNSLAGDPCHEGCIDCPANADCIEFPHFDNIVCSVEFCLPPRTEIRPCFDRFQAQHPELCHVVR